MSEPELLALIRQAAKDRNAMLARAEQLERERDDLGERIGGMAVALETAQRERDEARGEADRLRPLAYWNADGTGPTWQSQALKADFDAAEGDRRCAAQAQEIERLQSVDWQSMESVPDGERVFLLLRKGEKGNGELAVGMVWKECPDHYWTWGGPNSGSDINEWPEAWAPLPANWSHLLWPPKDGG